MDIQTPGSAPSNSRKSVVVWVVVGLVAIFGGIVFLLNSEGPGPDPVVPPVVSTPQPPKTAEEIVKRQAAVLETSRDAIGLGEEDKCAQLLTKDEQDTCRAYVITSEAQQKLDIKLCDAITAEYWRSNCKDQVMTYRAIATGDSSLCSSMIVKERTIMCRRALGL